MTRTKLSSQYTKEDTTW